ncbi:hypothetical protein, conserved [Leishmania tarentolae]|uniref:Uncharacterized protein n=1 Tax=Leishmania tarentolae TaxID=5689 RepID=A0A640KGM1_LEITA|nr:hypothetical protein, conserved [Leishmania tarentolae]
MCPPASHTFPRFSNLKLPSYSLPLRTLTYIHTYAHTFFVSAQLFLERVCSSDQIHSCKFEDFSSRRNHPHTCAQALHSHFPSNAPSPGCCRDDGEPSFTIRSRGGACLSEHPRQADCDDDCLCTAFLLHGARQRLGNGADTALPRGVHAPQAPYHVIQWHPCPVTAGHSILRYQRHVFLHCQRYHCCAHTARGSSARVRRQCRCWDHHVVVASGLVVLPSPGPHVSVLWWPAPLSEDDGVRGQRPHFLLVRLWRDLP